MIAGIKGVNPETEEEDFRPASDDAPFSALAFKIATDPYRWQVCATSVSTPARWRRAATVL